MSATSPFVNPFESNGNWYKANLHTHTTTSDGGFSVQERIQQYYEKGYSILAITDHDRTNDVSALSTDDFLVISGTETHPNCPGADPYHFVFLNVPYGFDCSSEPNPNARIKMAREAGGEAIICHPYWCGHNINHLMKINGAIALEVYNATCTKIGKGLSSVQWDDLLDAGIILPAVAVDDAHRGRDIFMGWTWFKAENLTAEDVMEALRTGCFYSSCGPVIEDARVCDGKVIVKCSPASEVHFIAQRSHGFSIYSDGEGPITSAEIPLRDSWRYLRIEIVDLQGNRAWTNPLVVR
ncbi:MAG: CehA/McbA family metallohydrolase [Armatimonadota bacterium]|nr:CehA/McbA family metallohydrolase [Armatimonadota bacterium]